MTAELTLEMLQKWILTNSYPVTHNRLTQELLATMQREAKLLDALEEMHALYAGTDRTLDPTEVCGKVQELLYCSEYSDDTK